MVVNNDPAIMKEKIIDTSEPKTTDSKEIEEE